MKRTIIVSTEVEDSKNQILCHPDSGLKEFAQIPQLEKDGIVIPSGPAFLQLGWHGPNKTKGEGARHIWERHGQELGNRCSRIEEVPRYVANILTKRAQIFVGLESVYNDPDIEIVNPRYGKVVMYSERTDGAVRYFILTAYADRYALRGFREYEKKGILIGPLFPK